MSDVPQIYHAGVNGKVDEEEIASITEDMEAMDASMEIDLQLDDVSGDDSLMESQADEKETEFATEVSSVAEESEVLVEIETDQSSETDGILDKSNADTNETESENTELDAVDIIIEE